MIDKSPIRTHLIHVPPPIPISILISLGAFGAEWTETVLSTVMFPPITTSINAAGNVPASSSQQIDEVKEEEYRGIERKLIEKISSEDPGPEVGIEGGKENKPERARFIPSVVTFVTGNAKKLKEVEEILLTYQTSFKLVSEKVRDVDRKNARHAVFNTILNYTTLKRSVLWYTIPYYTTLYYTIQYYIILYYTILYYTILYYTILYYTILYYTILYYTIVYFPVLYYTMLYYTILYYTILYYTILYYTKLYYTILYYTTLYYTILYFTILYYTILYFTILNYTILYYTIQYTILHYTILYYTILY